MLIKYDKDSQAIKCMDFFKICSYLVAMETKIINYVQNKECPFIIVWTIYIISGTYQKVKIKLLCSSDINKHHYES